MKIIADLHLHSYFSRATSKQLNLENLHKWAQLKGVNVVGSGDIAHPGWLKEMREKLEPAEDGLFQLCSEYARPVQREVFASCQDTVRFMLAGEISNIYKRHDKVRKVHNVVFMPSFDSLEKFQARLERIGNIRSDGRPILGLDSRDLLEIVLEIDPQGYLIPAHIWTPWFAMLGSMSGFDSVEECFGDLSDHIFALETGLSSDPPMNWRLSILDKYTLVSNSDAHSPQKLAREANVFNTELSYSALFDALKTGDPDKFEGTIEFFPEEGKYHYDGHRKCKICWHPQETLAHDYICAGCGKKVTVGVMHRVEMLADRPRGFKPEGSHPFKSLAPLPELLSEVHTVGPTSKRVQKSFEYLLSHIGSELHILLTAPIEEIKKVGGEMISEAIRRMRNNEISVKAGYDGEYGVIQIFDEDERKSYSSQLSFFMERVANPDSKPQEQAKHSDQNMESAFKSINKRKSDTDRKPDKNQQRKASSDNGLDINLLNERQQSAIRHSEGPLLIVAGPGTGKTATLTCKIAYLLQQEIARPEQIIAITFTNRASVEMKSRLAKILSPKLVEQLRISTFHALAKQILTDATEVPVVICAEFDKKKILQEIDQALTTEEINHYAEAIALAKCAMKMPDMAGQTAHSGKLANFSEIYLQYQKALLENGLFDFEDLILRAIQIEKEAVDDNSRMRFQYVFIDEYQDLDKSQYELLKLLTKNTPNVFAIGDPNQAIYGFRGADPVFFQKFEQDYRHAKTINLNKSYRSTQNILSASRQALFANHQTEPELRAVNAGKEKIVIHAAMTERAEAEFVIQQIESLIRGTSYFSIDTNRVADESTVPDFTFADIAVLARSKALFPPLIEAFERSGLPYEIIGGKSIMDAKIVKLVLSLLFFLENQTDSFHLEYLLENSKDGIGEATLRQLINASNHAGQSLWQTCNDRALNPSLTKRQINSIQRFTQKYVRLSERAKNQPVAETINNFIVEFGLAPEPGSLEETNLEKLVLLARNFSDNLSIFLSKIGLSKEEDHGSFNSDRIKIMTLHGSKGLEFETVFIVGCEEGLIPYEYLNQTSDLSEEKRLLYVGMTRAKSKLYLTHAQKRSLFGQTRNPKLCRYVDNLDQALMEMSRRDHSSQREAVRKPVAQIDLFNHLKAEDQ